MNKRPRYEITRRIIRVCRFTMMAGMTLYSFLICADIEADTLEVSSRRLIEHAKFYDGKIVTYRGEAVTAVMMRGEYAWVNVNDGDNAIGVWCKASSMEQVKFLGNYKTRGDIVEIVGVFNRACQEHGGDLDIHADTVTVKRSGRAIPEVIDINKIQLIVVLFLATIAIAAVFRKRI